MELGINSLQCLFLLTVFDLLTYLTFQVIVIRVRPAPSMYSTVTFEYITIAPQSHAGKNTMY